MAVVCPQYAACLCAQASDASVPEEFPLIASGTTMADMSTYFTAATDGAALDALTAPLDGSETVESVVSPLSDAFAYLVGLIRGEDLGDGGVAGVVVIVDTSGNGERVVRIGGGLRDTVADMDEDTLQDLTGPWTSDSSVESLDFDAEDFLTDFQHLCRNALAENADVYAIERL